MEEAKRFTTRNASTFSAYDIRLVFIQPFVSPSLTLHRQELNRRGAFDFKETDTVNFKTMLQRLMVELVAEEAAEAEERTNRALREKMAADEELKRERDRKKAEALERSRQRQANPEYFKQKTALNQKPQQETSADGHDPSADQPSASNEAIAAAEEDERDEDDAGKNADPFRSYSSKTRSKVFVK
jgi:hypothetical protein